MQPAACELMDKPLADIARKAYPHFAKALPPPDVAASLIVEYDGDTLEEVKEKLAKVPPAIDWAVKWNMITDPAEQKMTWSARKAAVPLLFRMPGKKQPVPFIEDVAVPVEKFPEYIHGLEAILGRYGTPVSYFAHAGHGECHTRPYLDLHDPAEVDKMLRDRQGDIPVGAGPGRDDQRRARRGAFAGSVHQAPVRAAVRPDAAGEEDLRSRWDAEPGQDHLRRRGHQPQEPAVPQQGPSQPDADSPGLPRRRVCRHD